MWQCWDLVAWLVRETSAKDLSASKSRGTMAVRCSLGGRRGCVVGELAAVGVWARSLRMPRGLCFASVFYTRCGGKIIGTKIFDHFSSLWRSNVLMYIFGVS